ncbi:DUF5615 family PIN-like protein [Leptolyngbya sp. BC1307]|uniref:DUF5615 family PIN-like protein n=1 Tax=Leptolyngbya sp. BC1307 TaxID=2029589 RepID=UPI000EFD74C2|nr:DUF5615 family PIN-like protein [Leptolyngbya sp. BC1307]
MLSFLLDEHISPKVGTQLQKKLPEITVRALQTWQQGRYLQASDELLLTVAAQHSLTLVTYDTRTIPTLLRSLAVQGQHHSGIVFIDQKTIAASDIGKLTKALLSLWKAENKSMWTDRIMFLRSPR